MKYKLCRDNLESCFCGKKRGHRGNHRCRCGGEWDKWGNPITLPDMSRGFNSFPSTRYEKNFIAKKILKNSKGGEQWKKM